MSVRKAIARAWRDPAFKAKLLSHPHAALAEVGVTVPADVEVRVVEDTARRRHLVLPAAPSGVHELHEKDLERISGGFYTLRNEYDDGDRP